VLEVLRRGRRWGTAVIVILVGGVFIVYFGVGGPMQCGAPSGAVVAVGDRSFQREDFLRLQEQREAQIREAAGDAFDASAARDFLRANTTNTLITRAILAEEAERLGLGVTKEEIRDRIRSDPGFQDETGRFRVDYYESWVQYEYGNEGHFLEMQATELLAVKLARLLRQGARVSAAEARQAALHRTEEARLAFVALHPEEPARLGVATEEISEEEVAAFAADHAEALSQRYEATPARWETPAAVRLRHILIQKPEGEEPDELEAARSRAQSVLERIREGAAFADVALEVSEDEASRESGGDLGFVPPDELAPTLREAAENLEPGQVSEVLEDDAGFHLVRLEGRRSADRRSFDEVRDELARELLVERRAEARARELAEALRTAVAEGQSLEAAAREQGLTVERTGWLRRRPDGFIPGLGASKDVQDAAFALEPGASAPRIFEVDGQLALLQVLERRQPDPETLEARAEQERERLLAQEQERLLTQWIERRRDRLEQQGRLAVNLDLLDRAPAAQPPPGGFF